MNDLKKAPMLGFWMLLLAVFLPTGCSIEGSSETESDGFRVDTLENGRVQVRNTDGAWPEGGAWTAEEDLRIGTLEGEGPDQFGQIAGLKADSTGQIYVLDYMAQAIRVFDPEGGYSHTIGGKGEGPGELMQAAGLNWGPEGDLWVWDPGGRFSVFTPAGEFVQSKRRLVRGVIFPWRGDFDLDGSLIDWGLDYPGLNPGSGSGPTRIIYYPVRFSGDFETGDTLPNLEFEFELTNSGERMIFSEGLSPYQDRRGAIWFAHNKAFTLYRRTLEGDTTLQFSIEATPVSVTGREMDSVRALYVEQGRPGSAPEADMFAPEKPMIRRVFGDNSGHSRLGSKKRPEALFISSRRIRSIPASNSKKCIRHSPSSRSECPVATGHWHTVDRIDGSGSGLAATLNMTTS